MFWRVVIQAILFLMLAGIPAIIFGVLAIHFSPEARTFTTTEARKQWFTSDPWLMFWMQLILLGGVLAVVLTTRLVDRRPLSDIGLCPNKRWLGEMGFGFALGATSMGLIFGSEWLLGWARISGVFAQTSPDFRWTTGFVLGLLMFSCVALLEEAQSRGYHLRNFAEGLNFGGRHPRAALIAAWVLSSLIFGAVHAGNDHSSWVSTANVVAGGVVLALPVLLTGELAIPIGLHLSWNFFQGYVFGFPVSGHRVPCSLIAIEQAGPDAWTGGGFGPEAGLMGLAAVGFQTVAILIWVRVRRGTLALRADWASFRL